MAALTGQETTDRRERIIALRDEGWTSQRIGAEFGTSPGRAGKLYLLALRDRENQRLEAARQAATLDTPSAHLGLDADMTFALAHLGISGMRAIVERDADTLARTLLRYPNVNARSLRTLLDLRARFAPADRPTGD